MNFTEDEVFSEIGRLHMQIVKLQAVIQATAQAEEEPDAPHNSSA